MSLFNRSRSESAALGIVYDIYHSAVVDDRTADVIGNCISASTSPTTPAATTPAPAK